ncbi:hypothetical protein G159_02370 [Planococcus glaciei CHR43]|nr:hypothetical protein G159_02370 [Planococcus glaciei CHR43]
MGLMQGYFFSNVFKIIHTSKAMERSFHFLYELPDF